jgi:hypothetical protein
MPANGEACMKKSKTIYLDTLNQWIAILFATQIYLFTTQGLANLSKIKWFAISQFVLAGGLSAFLLIHYLLNINYGKKYIYFDETGVEFKMKYFRDKTFLHWEHIGRIRFDRQSVLISLKNEDAAIRLKCPYDKFQEIREDFVQFVEPLNIVIEQRHGRP